MGELITAIALLCQVSAGTGFVSYHSYALSATHEKQKKCHKKLVKCFYSHPHYTVYPQAALADCIKKGDY